MLVRADAVADGLVDVLDRAAPEPVVVVEVGVADEALGAAAVTRRAVGLEGRRAAGHGKAQQVRLALDLLERGGGELVAQAALRGLRRP